MKATVLAIFTLLLIGAGLSVLLAQPNRLATQVKIEPGKKSKPATPSPTPHKPIVNRTRRAAPKIEMVLVPGGDFLMGSPESEPDHISNEGPQHRVDVSSFYIGKYEVTQAQWSAVMSDNPSHFRGDDLPVEGVSWEEAKEFCRRLSQMTGKEYRLPTEAEWEYACRAGTTGAYAGDLDAMAWYIENSKYKLHPVGQKLPNKFGLYDMLGNAWEWCEDVYHDGYAGAPTDGSAWLSGGDSIRRMLRGGTYVHQAQFCRTAFRFYFYYDGRVPMSYVGFRVVVSARRS